MRKTPGNRPVQGQRISNPKRLLIAAAFFLAACQFAPSSKISTAPTPADVSPETSSPAAPPTAAMEPSPTTAGLIQLLEPLDEPETTVLTYPVLTEA